MVVCMRQSLLLDYILELGKPVTLQELKKIYLFHSTYIDSELEKLIDEGFIEKYYPSKLETIYYPTMIAHQRRKL